MCAVILLLQLAESSRRGVRAGRLRIRCPSRFRRAARCCASSSRSPERHSTLRSLCRRLSSAVTSSAQAAARTPGNLLAEIAMPMPVPQMRMPRSTSPLLTFLGHQRGEIGIVDAGFARRAVVDDRVALGLQQRNHLFLEVISAMIAGDGNFHRWPLGWPATRRRHRSQSSRRSMASAAAAADTIAWRRQLASQPFGMMFHAGRQSAPRSGDRRRRSARSDRPRRLRSGISMRVRSAASGQRSTIDCRWLCVIVRIKSAWRTSCSVSGCASWRDQVEAVLAHHLHGFGRRRATGRGRDAGRHHHDAAILQLVELALQAFGQLCAHQQLGHRAAARVAGADEQHHDAGQPLERRFADDAFAQASRSDCS